MEGGGICVLAWKQRTGLIQSYLDIIKRDKKASWEQRWIVLSSTGELSYYMLGEEDKEPRGFIDLTAPNTKINIEVISQKSTNAPTPNEIDISSVSADATIKWKFCFETQVELMNFLEAVHKVLDRAGNFKLKDTDRFEHDFLPGDHIFRWEMIVCPPVIYPIQIHAIVLEAGRNCFVIADFGLTGYGRKPGEEFNHDDENNRANIVLAAYNKLRPTSVDQRLHVRTLTDQHEIRKWFKANYEEGFFNRKKDSSNHKFDHLSKFFSNTMKSISSSTRDSTSSHRHDDPQTIQEQKSNTSEGGESTSSSTSSPKSPIKAPKSPTKQSVKVPPELDELPKSDPIPLVLARAHFLLECGEQVLPPYHVFHSNSECLAVWCKTGRWSTLQTAVFLSTNSVGGAKSATMATIGVAAAHAILAPVVAVGGLIWVSAPMVILQKSRGKWAEYTMLMTDLFWSQAPPAAFISAIESWSDLGYNDNNNRNKFIK